MVRVRYSGVECCDDADRWNGVGRGVEWRGSGGVGGVWCDVVLVTWRRKQNTSNKTYTQINRERERKPFGTRMTDGKWMENSGRVETQVTQTHNTVTPTHPINH